MRAQGNNIVGKWVDWVLGHHGHHRSEVAIGEAQVKLADVRPREIPMVPSCIGSIQHPSPGVAASIEANARPRVASVGAYRRVVLVVVEAVGQECDSRPPTVGGCVPDAPLAAVSLMPQRPAGMRLAAGTAAPALIAASARSHATSC